jgi:hypothetical protein
MNGIFSFSRPSIPLGPSTETVATGGGAATPVADEFAKFLQSILTGGFATTTVPGQPRELSRRPGMAVPTEAATTRRDPVDQTTGIAQALNALIAGPDVSGQQSAVQEIIQKDTERQTANLRERFTAGGGSRGTPSAVAEGLFRSNVTPRIAAATGELDLRANQQRNAAVMQFLRILAAFSGRGVPQAEESIIVQPGPLDYLAGFAESGAGIAGAV